MPAGTQLLLHVFQYLAEDLIQRPYGGYFQPLIGRVDIVGHAAQIDHVELTAALARLGLENTALDTGVYPAAGGGAAADRRRVNGRGLQAFRGYKRKNPVRRR